ncbi:unnamed protein product, partial [Ectocarpus sp. 12 AP-2014]
MKRAWIRLSDDYCFHELLESITNGRQGRPQQKTPHFRLPLCDRRWGGFEEWSPSAQHEYLNLEYWNSWKKPVSKGREAVYVLRHDAPGYPDAINPCFPSRSLRIAFSPKSTASAADP